MRYLIYLFTVSILALTGACSNQHPSSSKKPLVIVSVSPYDTFIKSIAQDTLDVRVAVPANYNPHLFEPTLKQMEGFQHAFLWFGIGEPFETTILNSLKSYNNHLITVDLSVGININTDHEHETISPCNSDHHHNHLHEGVDRHFWMSPSLSLLQTETIKNTLVELFPEHKELYEDNFLKIKERFTNLNQDISSLLISAKNHAIIVSHPALGYFCQDYDLIQISIECEGKTPLPGDLKKILSLSKIHPVLCVFTQEQFDNKGAIILAKKLELPIYNINPNDPHYFDNLETLAKHIAQSKTP